MASLSFSPCSLVYCQSFMIFDIQHVHCSSCMCCLRRMCVAPGCKKNCGWCVMVCMGFLYFWQLAFETLIEVTWMFIAGGMKRLCGPWGMASILTDVLLVARKNNTIVNIMVVHPGISWALTSLSMGILLTVLLANFDCTVHGGVVSACRFCRQRDVLCVMVCMGFFYLRHWAFETMIEVTWMFFAGGGKRLCGSWGMLENFYNMMCVLIADGTYWWQLRGARELLRHDVRFDRQWHLLSVFFCVGFFYVRQWAFETMIEVTWMVIAVCGRRLCGSWGMVFSSSRKYGTHVEKKCHRYCGYRAGSTLHCSINMRKIFHKASADVFENFYDMMCVLIADGTYWWQHYGDMMVSHIFSGIIAGCSLSYWLHLEALENFHYKMFGFFADAVICAFLWDLRYGLQLIFHW